MPGLKTDVENDILWSEMGQDLQDQAAHSHQEFQGVPPEGSHCLWNGLKYSFPRVRIFSSFAIFLGPHRWRIKVRSITDRTKKIGSKNKWPLVQKNIDIYKKFKTCVSQCLLSTQSQPSYLELGKVSPQCTQCFTDRGSGFRMRPKVYTQDSST